MSFDTLLIANRGEIACRIMDTSRRKGLRTVAVYSDADSGSRHVALADAAVHIGGSAASDSYLRGDAIIAAAKAAGAGAIHPGYGFLSESPEFAEAVVNAGLVFIGPSAEAIRAMGLKDRAKALMADAGVPVVPGYAGDDQSEAALAEAATSIGYPVLIKAVAGGGGKGMRRVDNPKQFADALQSARSEARNAFGNDRVLIEKWISKPRHIEVQIFGDGTRAVHLFERDCSLQRRHQKVIEEAPAPGMTEEMRRAMGEAAVRAAEAVNYTSAGTVEFIVDAADGLHPDRFWFMEMNTRLQVEHPVTEAITGVDLVEWQLEIAAGRPLPLAQQDLSIAGHAIEARLYAEDPGAGFLPATGHLSHLVFPKGARIDTGVRSGDEITSHYDPMIAKLTVHGADRRVALMQLKSALEQTEIAGTTTNTDFLTRLVAHPDFQSGNLDTGIIDREGTSLTDPSPPSSDARAIAAVATLRLLDDGEARQGFALWSSLRHRAPLEGASHWVTPTTTGGVVDLDGTQVKVVQLKGSLFVDGRKVTLKPVEVPAGIRVFGRGGGLFATVDPLASVVSQAPGGTLAAPMPGRIVAVHVSSGESVEAGQRLITLEAMKMEHVIAAPTAGLVTEVLAGVGQQVDTGQVLVVMEDESEPTP